MLDTLSPDHLRLLAEQAGLKRALEKFPDGVKAGVERGLKPVGDPPGGHSPTAHPGFAFKPDIYERKP